MIPGKLSQDAFTEPRSQGIWQRLLQALQQQAEAKGKIDWEIHGVDGSVIRASRGDRLRQNCSLLTRVSEGIGLKLCSKSSV